MRVLWITVIVKYLKEHCIHKIYRKKDRESTLWNWMEKPCKSIKNGWKLHLRRYNSWCLRFKKIKKKCCFHYKKLYDSEERILFNRRKTTEETDFKKVNQKAVKHLHNYNPDELNCQKKDFFIVMFWFTFLFR